MMIKVYAAFDPTTGLYARFDTLDECLNNAAENAYRLFMIHTHESPFSTIEIDQDGNEIWKSASGQSFISPEHLEAEAKARIQRLILSNQPTPVEQMP